MKSDTIWLERYFSILKPLVKVTVRFSSTTARESDSTVTTVLLRLRPRLAFAMASRDTPPDFFTFFFSVPPSVYRTASMGLTFAARRPGREQDSSTVSRENSAEITKMTGLADTMLWMPLSRAMMTGVSREPMNHPISRPRGMPTRERSSACWRMMCLSCRPVVPMVFSNP